MKIDHLMHDDESICCKKCGFRFETSSKALSNPLLLLEMKQEIAVSHTCPTAADRPERVRVYHHPTGPEQLSDFWTAHMAKHGVVTA